MALAALLIVAGLGLAPYVYAEVAPILEALNLPSKPPPLIAPGPGPGAPGGAVVATPDGGRWRVQRIAPQTWALGEPAEAPDNYEYLLAGHDRALLIDAGATAHDIRPVLATLTTLPVTVIPTHLHHDHTNGLRHFSDVALIDLPQTRERVAPDGLFHLDRWQYMAPLDEAPTFKVTRWIKRDSTIDLGGRAVKVMWTPGHTATSVSLSDPAAKLLFTGDLIYTTSLYVFMPDSSLAAYDTTAERLLAALPPDTLIYGAHCCRNEDAAQAPWLNMGDLRDLRRATQAIEAGKASGTGFILRRFPVNSRITLITLYPFANH